MTSLQKSRTLMKLAAHADYQHTFGYRATSRGFYGQYPPAV